MWEIGNSADAGFASALSEARVKPQDYEGIRLYWTDVDRTRERLKRLGYGVSELEHREYGQTEFFLTDDDGYSHCFGVPTQR